MLTYSTPDYISEYLGYKARRAARGPIFDTDSRRANWFYEGKKWVEAVAPALVSSLWPLTLGRRLVGQTIAQGVEVPVGPVGLRATDDEPAVLGLHRLANLPRRHRLREGLRERLDAGYEVKVGGMPRPWRSSRPQSAVLRPLMWATAPSLALTPVFSSNRATDRNFAGLVKAVFLKL